MILIEVNEQELKHTHLTHIRSTVVSRILNQKSKFHRDLSFMRYNILLNYLIINIDDILGGNLDVLKKIIKDIETNFYISEGKVKSLLRKRKKEGVTAKDKNLRAFINRNNLSKYLPISSREDYNNLDDFKRDMKNIYEQNILTIFSNPSKGSTEKITFEEALYEIFNYKNFSEIQEDRKNTWDAYKYTELLNISVCPYCDRQFIHTFINKEKKMRAVLDHFYAKSLYPYLAISIFNLVPCCNICNSSFKHDVDLYNEEIVYPFEEEFKNNVEFRIKAKSYLGLIGLDADIEIEFYIKTKNSSLRSKIEKSIELFALKEVYSNHKLFTTSLIRSIYINNSTRINELYRQNLGLFKSTTEVKNLLYLGMDDEKSLGKHVLSKLQFDIIQNYKK